MPLPKEILEIFYKTLNGDLSVLEFEEWLYDNRQLEEMMDPDDYMDLIAFGYKGPGTTPGLHELLRKHVGKRELAFWKFIRKKYPQGYTPTPIKTPFDEQLQRIKDKLILAKDADKNCMIYGSECHEYILSVPATEEEVSAFEHKYSIQLPDCYRAFLLVVGNGGIETEDSYRDSGAGPGCGIYPLGTDAEKNNLTDKCLLDPEMTKDQWESLRRRYGHKVFGGVLTLGTQGCTYDHALVLNGPHKGLVVNLDYNYIIPPIFTPNVANFLDYYEGWLDEVIDGTRLKPGAGEYGYYK